MITLTAQMSDASTITATYNDNGTFAYSSSFVLQVTGFYFPGMTISHDTPIASAVMEGTRLVFRLGASTDPVLPYGQDFQKFEIDTFTRQGQECFTEDGQTITHCRSIVSADLSTTAPESHQVPIPGWALIVLGVMLVAARMTVCRR